MPRILLVFAVALTLSGCELWSLLPTSAVMPKSQYESEFMSPPASGARYSGAPRAEFPVLPFQVWGVAYDLDLVIVIDHPKWQMHEFARVPTREGPIWIAKEADFSGLQTVVADDPRVHDLVPEVNVPRLRNPVTVKDQSLGDKLKIGLSYVNRDGEPVEVSYEGPAPKPQSSFRNGNTMGHSKQTVIAVLDIEAQSHADSARVKIAGKEFPIRKIYGLYSFMFALEQTQSGLSAGTFIQRPGASPSFVVSRGELREEPWKISEKDGRVLATRTSPVTNATYEFRKSEGSLEFVRAEISQFGRDAPCTRLEVTPALPDLRRPFSGTHESRFVIHVNDQIGHATGVIRVTGNERGAVIDILPDAPRWVADRPMKSVVEWQGETARVEGIRVQ